MSGEKRLIWGKFHVGALSLLIALLAVVKCVQAQYVPFYPAYPPNYNVAYAPPPVAPAPPVFATPQIVARLTAAQIDQLVEPIALYPDPLLAQILPASTYPQQVMLAAQWLAYNPNPSQVMIDMQNWDPSVKALVHYPDVVANMSANPAWMQALGVAFLNQQADVMEAIQTLRARAVAAGTLRSTPQQQVIIENGVIWIEPVNPQIIYVPQYNPALVYAPEPGYVAGTLVTFGLGFAIGDWLNNDCNWRNHWISVGAGWRTNWRRSKRGAWVRIRHEDQNGRRGIGPARNIPQRWMRDPRQPLPALPANMVERGALRQYRGWPEPSPANGRTRAVGRRGQARAYIGQAPAGIFGGRYRTDSAVTRDATRGRASWREARSWGQKGGGNRGPTRTFQTQWPRAPQAFRPAGSESQVRQQSQRGRASMGRRR